MGLGFWELAILLVVVLLFFGAHKLPSAMGDIAQGIKAFKTGMKDRPDEAPEPRPAPKTPAQLTDRRDEGLG
jgi:sec-independent protein translocase protein TatA